jgi:hypothetical protein
LPVIDIRNKQSRNCKRIVFSNGKYKGVLAGRPLWDFEEGYSLNLLPSLFSPIKIKSMDLVNRAVMPPMGTNLGNPDGTVSEANLAYIRTESNLTGKKDPSLYNR